MKITLELPDQLGLTIPPEELSQQVLLSHALLQFKEGKISLGLAKEVAGLSIYDFMQACNKHHIPVVNYSTEDLKSEIDAIKQNLI